MNQMEVFNNPEFGSVRIIEENGSYLFSGLDVANALGYSNSRASVSRHCRYVTKRDVPHPQSPGQTIRMTFIPEGDVYRLIVHSKLPSAERFEKWVFDEVMPAIRKHGAYMTKEKLWQAATSPEALMKLCSELLAEQEENAALRKKTHCWKARRSIMICSSTQVRTPTCASPQRSCPFRSGSLSGSCWSTGLYTAPNPGPYSPTQSPAMNVCSASKTSAETATLVPTLW